MTVFMKHMHVMLACVFLRLSPALRSISLRRGFLWERIVAAMVKETQFLRRQAKKAELMAKAISDIEASQSFSALAKANRSQADFLEKGKENVCQKPVIRNT
jgi:hypothetical protein